MLLEENSVQETKNQAIGLFDWNMSLANNGLCKYSKTFMCICHNRDVYCEGTN